MYADNKIICIPKSPKNIMVDSWTLFMNLLQQRLFIYSAFAISSRKIKEVLRIQLSITAKAAI